MENGDLLLLGLVGFLLLKGKSSQQPVDDRQLTPWGQPGGDCPRNMQPMAAQLTNNQGGAQGGNLPTAGGAIRGTPLPRGPQVSYQVQTSQAGLQNWDAVHTVTPGMYTN